MAERSANKTKISIGFPSFVFFAVLLLADFSLYAYLPFFAALLHEAGHLLAMKMCGQKVSRIKIYPFGVDIRKRQELSSYKADLFISSAGILTNVLLIVICSLLPDHEMKNFFVSANIVLIIINILPIRSLDGGQMLEKLLLLKLDLNTTDTIMNSFSFVSIFMLGTVAIWLLFYTSYNFSLLLMCMYLFCGLFLGKSN